MHISSSVVSYKTGRCDSLILAEDSDRSDVFDDVCVS
jgi:hypothetical protein